MRRITTHWTLLLLPLLLWSCVAADGMPGSSSGNSGDDPFEGGPDDVKIYDNVLVGDEDPCLVGVDFEEDREVLTFIFTCEPTGRGYEPGMIVVGTDNGGYLRRIVSVQIQGQTLIAWTEFASLNEVIEEGGFSGEIDLGDEERGNLIDIGGTTLYHGDVGPAELLIELQRGAFDINPSFVMDGHWADGELKTYDIDLGIDLLADVKVAVTSTDGVRIGKSIPVWEHNFPFTFAIGPIPVIGAIEMKLSVGARVDIGGDATLTTGLYSDLKLHNRKEYTISGGWKDADVSEGEFRHLEPELDISNKAKVSVFGQLDSFVKMYGVAGPSFRTRIHVGVRGNLVCDGIDYEVEAGVMGRGSIKLNLFNRFHPEKIFLKVTFTVDLMGGHLPWPGHLSPVPCTDEEIMCGQTITGDTREADDPWLHGYTCNVGNYAAPEKIYMWKATKTGPATFELIDPEPNIINHDVFVAKGLWDLMNGNCEEWGLNELTLEAEAGETYYFIVDGYDDDSGTFSAKLTCDEDNPLAGGDPGDTSNPF